MACKIKEEFAFYHIKQLVNFHFDRKSNFDSFTSNSSSKLPPIPILFPLLLLTLSLSIVAPANISIYPIQLSEIRLTSATYSTSILYTSSSRLISEVYIQFLSIGFSSIVHMSSGIRLTPIAYMQSPNIGPLFKAYK